MQMLLQHAAAITYGHPNGIHVTHRLYVVKM